MPVIFKEARLVEKVSLSKEASERNETICDTVRKTEVDIEELSTSKHTTSATGTSGDL